MSYLALYRKYRPTSFDAVIGQKHIVTSLKNQIANSAISHAYLFTGTRGTGKTSIAKIFARAINCEHPINSSPCGKCNTCVALSDPSNLDIAEIDAASNNRVDEIRDLREKVKYPPVNGKYKVYIVDEVHMLTDSAFNALLKTLEEPPKHVVFILATTEVQKLPATILSRCLRFDFKLLENEEIEGLLKYVFDDSDIKYDNESVALIARLGEGSVRDALSVAEMCVAYTNKNVTYESVIQAVGAIDRASLSKLSKNIIKGNVNDILNLVNQILDGGKAVTQLAKDLASYFRDLAVVKTCNNANDILKYPLDIFEQMKEICTDVEVYKILNIFKTMASLDNEFRYSTSPRSLFELTVLSLSMENVTNLEGRVSALEEKVQNLKSNKSVNIAVSTATLTQKTNFSKEILNEVNNFPSYKFEDDKTLFGKLMVNIRNNQDIVLLSLLGNIENTKCDEKYLYLCTSDSTLYSMLNKKENNQILDEAMESFSKLKVKPTLTDKKVEEDIEKIIAEKFKGYYTKKI